MPLSLFETSSIILSEKPVNDFSRQKKKVDQASLLTPFMSWIHCPWPWYLSPSQSIVSQRSFSPSTILDFFLTLKPHAQCPGVSLLTGTPQILPNATVEEFVPKHASQYIEIEQASFIERHVQ